MDIDKNTDEGYCMDIVEKAKKWDTWDDIVKDFHPYLHEVMDRVKNHDKSIIKDFYTLKLFSSTKISDEYNKRYQLIEDSCLTVVASYGHVFDEILKLHRNKDKLDALLEAQTQLLDHQKREIREQWKKQDDPQTQLDNAMRKKNREEWWKNHNIETKEDDENFVVEDSQMEEYFKEKCVELAKIRDKLREKEDLQLKMRQVMWLMIQADTEIQNERIFKEASKSEHSQYKKLIKDMWPDGSYNDNHHNDLLPNLYDDDFEASFINDGFVPSFKVTTG